ncbi:MAG TPA: GNAT family N-acetyltransferase [Sphingomonas sp.]|jgi:phosphinothricin acetyltransferase|nr:GNAT family N-acetyltransferase [Sphingomonas sp.]
MTIAIRAATAADAEAIAGIYAPYVRTSTISFETEPPSAATMAERMASSPLHPWIVAIDEDGLVLGYAYATPYRARAAYRWTVETSVYLAGDQRGKGVGRLLYGRLLATLKAQGFVQAIAVIALPNDWSITMHEAVGFRRAGQLREVGWKAGSWLDIGYWQAELDEPSDPPAEVRAFADVGVVRG